MQWHKNTEKLSVFVIYLFYDFVNSSFCKCLHRKESRKKLLYMYNPKGRVNDNIFYSLVKAISHRNRNHFRHNKTFIFELLFLLRTIQVFITNLIWYVVCDIITLFQHWNFFYFISLYFRSI